jgi:hypothetical protein
MKIQEAEVEMMGTVEHEDGVKHASGKLQEKEEAKQLSLRPTVGLETTGFVQLQPFKEHGWPFPSSPLLPLLS